MAENIINRFSRSLDQGLASLYNRDQVVDLENQYGNQYGIQNSASGPLSDARHMSAMNNLSNSLSPMNNSVGNFIGDVGAFGAGLVNEVPAALTRGFNKENYGEIMEDIAANYAGSFGTPNTTTAEQIYDSVFSRGTPTKTASNIGNYGTAQAAEVNPQNEPMDIEDFLGTSTPQDLGFIGMAPSIKEAVAPIGITDRNRGMPGEPTGAYEMIGGTPVAVGDVLGMQQALEKADFYEEPTQGINLGGILNAAALFGGPLGFAFNKPALSLAGAIGNIATGRFGRAVDRAKSGLGSLGSKFAGSMRGINPVTGRPNTQAQYEQDRADRQAQNRTDNMIDRISRGKSTRSNPRDAGTTQAQKDAISEAIQDRARTGQYDKDDGGGSGGSSKIVCTMMNERYGFGSFRNKIWMKFHEHHGPEYQKGYHAIFLPLVKIAKGEGKINTAVRKVLEHMGRHVTADMFKIMKGKKRDTLGRIYRAIFEPACHIIGKIKSALGRG